MNIVACESNESTKLRCSLKSKKKTRIFGARPNPSLLGTLVVKSLIILTESETFALPGAVLENAFI